MLGFQPEKHQKTFGVLTPFGTEGELERFPREPRKEGRFAPGRGRRKGRNDGSHGREEKGEGRNVKEDGKGGNRRRNGLPPPIKKDALDPPQVRIVIKPNRSMCNMRLWL